MNVRTRRGSHSTAAAETVSTGPRRRWRPKKHNIYIICTVLAVIAVVTAAIVIRTVSDRKKYNQYMEQALLNYSQKDFDSALAVLRKADAIDDTEECVMLMADCYEAQGKLEKAVEVLKNANSRKQETIARISELEQRLEELKDEGKISIAGTLYFIDTTSLKLDDMGLDDRVISQIKQMYALDSLSLSGNRLRNISELAELGGISALDLSRNRISDISALTALGSLRTLCLDDNPINDLSPLASITSLTSLSIMGIEIDRETLETLSNALPNCAIHTDAQDEAVKDISFGGVTFKSDVKELSLSGMGIRDISALADCTELTHLDLSGNEISDLSPLMNIPTLEWLDVSSNRLTDLRTLMGIERLWFLNASDNAITDTSPFSMMISTKELYLDNNPIRVFSGLRRLQNLEKLGLSNTGLKDEDLEYLYDLAHLTQLYISDNDELSGEAVDALQIKINPCNITHSELVYNVEFCGRLYKSNVTELILPAAGITDIGHIQMLTQLETVSLARNDISNIYSLEYSNSRFTIKRLDLSANNIVDITALACLQSIEELDLSGNSIESVMPLMTLSSLKRLDLRANNISADQIKDLRYALQKCEILSDHD